MAAHTCVFTVRRKQESFMSGLTDPDVPVWRCELLDWGSEEDLFSQSAGCAEIGEELETEADHKVPDVSGHLRSCNKHSPDENYQHCVEYVADVPQPEYKQFEEGHK